MHFCYFSNRPNSSRIWFGNLSLSYLFNYNFKDQIKIKHILIIIQDFNTERDLMTTIWIIPFDTKSHISLIKK